jgi:hypothetical protein
MSFSATEAAFEGFRITRRHPAAVLAWAAVMLAANILSGLAVAVMAGPAWSQFETLVAASGAPDAAQIEALTPKVLPPALLSMLVQVVAAGMVNASVLRALLRPARSATLKFGRDELRVLGVMLMFILASFLATFALSILFGLLAIFLGQAVIGLASLASIVVLVVLIIRLSLAGPMTIAEHRFRFRESWAETRGRFFPLLGAEVLAAALALVVVFLAHLVFVGIAGAVVVAQGGALTDLGAMFNLDIASVQAMLAPLPLIYLAFVSVLYALVLVIMIGPPVELYRTLKGGVTDADPL